MEQKDLWNERYGERGELWGAAPNQFVVERLGDMEPSRVLDLGAGQGRNAIWLAIQGHTVTAVDISDVATAQGAAIAAQADVAVEFVAADLQTWEPETGGFDLVLLAYMQAPAAVRRMIHAKAALALKPGGRVFVVAHHKDNLEQGIGGPPMLEVLFDEESLASDFSDFLVTENQRVVRRVEDGDKVGDALDLVFDATKPES